MITREQQKSKYEKDIRYHSDPDNLNQSSDNRYNLRNNFGAYFEFRKQVEIVKLFNKHKIILKDKKILDIGCHKGLFLNLFAQLKGTSNQIYGVDFIKKFVDDAKKINPCIKYSQKDMYEGLTKYDKKYDLISAIYFFNCIPKKDHKKIAQDISREMKRQGG